MDLDRREFVVGGIAAVLGTRAGSRREPLALTTADKEAHVVVVGVADGRVRRRIPTREGPRSIECHGHGPAVVAHSAIGAVSLIDQSMLSVRRVLGGFRTPRYTAIGRGGAAYVTDGGTGELAVLDLARGRVVRRIAVGDAARHLTLSPDGRTLWIALGSSAAVIAVVDVGDRWRPVVRRHVRPPFLAHDVGFSPSGRRVWVSAGRTPQLAIYPSHGAGPPSTVGADAAPQHITFGPRFAYVASGNGGSVRLHSLSSGAVAHAARVPVGSYNVQRGAGVVVTPSLGAGTLTILDPHGNVRREVRVAAAAHDACVIG